MKGWGILFININDVATSKNFITSTKNTHRVHINNFLQKGHIQIIFYKKMYAYF